MCVVRTWDNMSFKALILGNVLNTHIINLGVACLEKFLLARKGREVILFSSIRLKKWMKRKWILPNWVEKITSPHFAGRKNFSRHSTPVMWIFKTLRKIRTLNRTLSHVPTTHTDKTTHGILNYYGNRRPEEPIGFYLSRLSTVVTQSMNLFGASTCTRS